MEIIMFLKPKAIGPKERRGVAERPRSVASARALGSLQIDYPPTSVYRTARCI